MCVNRKGYVEVVTCRYVLVLLIGLVDPSVVCLLINSACYVMLYRKGMYRGCDL